MKIFYRSTGTLYLASTVRDTLKNKSSCIKKIQTYEKISAVSIKSEEQQKQLNIPVYKA